MRLHELMSDNLERRGQNDYIFTADENGKYSPISFKTVIESAVYLAGSLLQMGLRGKKIIIYGENSAEWIISDLAVMAYVGVSVGIDKEWTAEDVSNSIDLLGASAVIYAESKKAVIGGLEEKFPDTVFISMQRDLPMLIDNGKHICLFDTSNFVFSPKSPDECMRVVFSSGTVSSPKAVMLSERNIFSGVESLKKRAPMDENDVCCLFLPLHHTYGGIYNFIYSLVFGYRIYLLSSAKNIASELSTIKPTIFCGVPLIFRRMFESAGGNGASLYALFGGKIKYLFCGGAYLDSEIRAAYRAAGLNLLIAYALSETASSFAIEYSGSTDTESAGTVFEDIDAKIINPDSEGIGELAVKGENVFLGYMNNPQETKKAFDKDGYFLTGDLGKIDDGGRLLLFGRKKRIILTETGENIYPENIERKIADKSANICSVRVSERNGSLFAKLYLIGQDKTDYAALISEVNALSAKYEAVTAFETTADSVETRLKQ